MVLDSLGRGIKGLFKGGATVFQYSGKGISWYFQELKLYLKENKTETKSRNMYSRYRKNQNL